MFEKNVSENIEEHKLDNKATFDSKEHELRIIQGVTQLIGIKYNAYVHFQRGRGLHQIVVSEKIATHTWSSYAT